MKQHTLAPVIFIALVLMLCHSTGCATGGDSVRSYTWEQIDQQREVMAKRCTERATPEDRLDCAMQYMGRNCQDPKKARKYFWITYETCLNPQHECVYLAMHFAFKSGTCVDPDPDA